MFHQKQYLGSQLVPGECIIVDFQRLIVNRDVFKIKRVMLSEVTFYEECLHDLNDELFYVDSSAQDHQTPYAWEVTTTDEHNVNAISTSGFNNKPSQDDHHSVIFASQEKLSEVVAEGVRHSTQVMAPSQQSS